MAAISGPQESRAPPTRLSAGRASEASVHDPLAGMIMDNHIPLDALLDESGPRASAARAPGQRAVGGRQAFPGAFELHCPISDAVNWHSENRTAARGKRTDRSVMLRLLDLYALPPINTRFHLRQQGGPTICTEALPGSSKTSDLRDHHGCWREDTVIAKLANNNRPIDALYGSTEDSTTPAPSPPRCSATAARSSLASTGQPQDDQPVQPPAREVGVIITKGSFEVRADGTWHPHGPPPSTSSRTPRRPPTWRTSGCPTSRCSTLRVHADGENFDFLGNLGV